MMKPSGPKHASSLDVAKRAGVSHMTVSRVFRSPEKVARETRENVVSAAMELGYVPSTLPGGLKSDWTDLVAIVVPSLENSLFSPTIDGLAEAVKPIGCDVIVAAYENDPELEAEVVLKLLSRRPVGLVLQSTVHTAECTKLLRNTQVPVVEIGDLIDNPIQAAVSFSNFEAAKSVTNHLIERNYQNIALVGLDPSINPRAQQRLSGYEAALREANRRIDPNLIRTAQPGFDGGADAVTQLIGKADAIFFSADVHAVGALLQCGRTGVSVPEDVAIAGFDDHAIARYCMPSLTCLTIPRREIGRRTGELIRSTLNKGPTKPENHDVGFTLNARAST